MERRDATRDHDYILHWFSGTSDELTRARRLGCYFSLNACWKRNEGRAYARAVSADRLLLETDEPPHEGLRGTRRLSDLVCTQRSTRSLRHATRTLATWRHHRRDERAFARSIAARQRAKLGALRLTPGRIAMRPPMPGKRLACPSASGLKLLVRTHPPSLRGDPVQRSGRSLSSARDAPSSALGRPSPPLRDAPLRRPFPPRDAPRGAPSRFGGLSLPASGFPLAVAFQLRRLISRRQPPTWESHLLTAALNRKARQPLREKLDKNSPICPIRGFRVFSSSITARPPNFSIAYHLFIIVLIQGIYSCQPSLSPRWTNYSSICPLLPKEGRLAERGAEREREGRERGAGRMARRRSRAQVGELASGRGAGAGPPGEAQELAERSLPQDARQGEDGREAKRKAGRERRNRARSWTEARGWARARWHDEKAGRAGPQTRGITLASPVRRAPRAHDRIRPIRAPRLGRALDLSRRHAGNASFTP